MMLNTIIPVFNSAVFLMLSALHFYWGFGGNWALNSAVPTDGNGRLLFKPGKFGAGIVALGLLNFGLCNLAFMNWISFGLLNEYGLFIIRAIGTIFLLRATGDFRYVGFTKQYRQTRFAYYDSRLYSPLCLVLGLAHWTVSLI